MLTDWSHWLSSIRSDELPILFFGLLLIDSPRYACSKLAMALWDFGRYLWQIGRRTYAAPRFTHCPAVCVVLAGYNEGDTVLATLESLWGSYPKLEIIVVDDGSQDRMADVAHAFARTHAGVQVLSRPQRGGKSSAMNFALPFSKAEVVINVDSDSALGPNAIWEIVQPFADPQVGAVSATIVARNPFTSLCSWLQAYEYMHTIFTGRMLAERFGVLGIASGAFAATRREALDRVMGWDVGPPEDLDLTMRVRKSGYKIAFAPYSQCFTDVPTTWRALFKQRLRWDNGIVRNFCRKHIDMADLSSRSFRFRDFALLFDNWFFQIFCAFAFAVYTVWFCINPPDYWASFLISLYVCCLVFEAVQCLSHFYYTLTPGRDALICAVVLLNPFYQMFLMGIRIVSHLQELIYRRSFTDNYVPKHVREATWHW